MNVSGNEHLHAGAPTMDFRNLRVIGVLTTHTRDDLAAADAFVRDLSEAHRLLGI